MSKTFSLLISFMLASSSMAAIRSVNWTYDMPARKRAIKGDTVILKWVDEHDVYEFPNKAAYEACNFSAATLKCDDDVQKCPIKMNRVGMRYFGCKETGHCAMGMKVAIKTILP